MDVKKEDMVFISKALLLAASPVSFILLLWYVFRFSLSLLVGWTIVTIAGNLLLLLIMPKLLIGNIRGTVDQSDIPSEVQSLVEEVARSFGLPTPMVGIFMDDDPNAFTVGVGKEHIIMISSGLIRTLSQEELRAVIAHEMAHISHKDVALGCMATGIGLVLRACAMVVGALVFIVALILLALFSKGRSSSGSALLLWGVISAVTVIMFPLFIMACQMAFSRRLEYDADEAASLRTGGPGPLIRALEKIHATGQMIDVRRSKGWAGEATLDLSFYHEPTSLKDRLISSHPPIHKRIERLRSLEGVHLHPGHQPSWQLGRSGEPSSSLGTRCQGCGKDIASDMRFCPYCGRRSG